MICTEELKIGPREIEFIHTWSDEHRYVVRDGVEYEDAMDRKEFSREYTEGDVIPYE